MSLDRCHRSLTRLETFVGNSSVYYVIRYTIHIYATLRCFRVINLKLFTTVTPSKVKLRIIKSLKLNYKISRTTKITYAVSYSRDGS